MDYLTICYIDNRTSVVVDRNGRRVFIGTQNQCRQFIGPKKGK